MLSRVQTFSPFKYSCLSPIQKEDLKNEGAIVCFNVKVDAADDWESLGPCTFETSSFLTRLPDL